MATLHIESAPVPLRIDEYGAVRVGQSQVILDVVIREFVEAGGLISYGPNFADLYRRAAELVDKILRGAKPGDIPVERPTKFDLIVNLVTARALRLTIPTSFLQRADEVID